MTVRRQRQESFDIPLEQARSYVLQVLAGGRWYYSYSHVEPSADGLTINARIRPKFWTLMLSTRIEIALREANPGCSVTARTQSQWLVLGDIFNSYPRLLDDFFTALDTASGHSHR